MLGPLQPTTMSTPAAWTMAQMFRIAFDLKFNANPARSYVVSIVREL